MSETIKTVRGKVKSFGLESIIVEKANGERRITGWASKYNKDRGGDIVEPTAFASSMQTFMANPTMLYMHKSDKVIGTWDKMNLTPEGLYVSGTIVKGVQAADEAWILAQHGALRALSIGFIEKDGEMQDDGYHIKDLELLEISTVSIPMNQEALFTVDGSKLLNIELLDPTEEADEKGVIGYTKYPTQAAGTAWDAGKARASLKDFAETDNGDDEGPSDTGDKYDMSKYAKGFTFVDGDANKFGSYKLPHHYASKGNLVTNLNGCRAVIGVIAGARGGMSLSDADKKGIYDHVAKHIKDDFGADVPAYADLGKMTDEELLTTLQITAEDIDSLMVDHAENTEETKPEAGGSTTVTLGVDKETDMFPDLTIPALLCEIERLSAILESTKNELAETKKIAEDVQQAFYQYISAQIKKLAAENGIN